MPIPGSPLPGTDNMLLLSTVSNVKERHLPGRGPSGWCGLISYWLNLRHTGRSSSSDPRSTGGRGTAPSNTELKLPENYLSCNQLTLSRLVHPLYRLDMASPGCVESCTFALRLDFLHTLRLQIPPPPPPTLNYIKFCSLSHLRRDRCRSLSRPMLAHVPLNPLYIYARS